MLSWSHGVEEQARQETSVKQAACAEVQIHGGCEVTGTLTGLQEVRCACCLKLNS
jgi:hypothetical protein